MFRGIISKIVLYAIPQLKPFVKDKTTDFNLVSVDKNVERNELTRTVAPYRIFNSTIGKGTYISVNSKISETTIGKFCSIGPNFLCGWGLHPTDGLSTSPYFYSTSKQNGGSVADKDLFKERQPIRIGNDVFIGANVTVLDGVTIGDGAIIGAGSIVSKSIPDFAIAFGNPIQIKKMRFNETQREQLKKIEWWNFSDAELKDVNRYFYDIDGFIAKYQKD